MYHELVFFRIFSFNSFECIINRDPVKKKIIAYWSILKVYPLYEIYLMDEEIIRKEINNVKVRFETTENHSSISNNPLSYFRLHIVPNLELNGFDKISLNTSHIDNECEEILKHALISNDYQLFDEILWLIKDENDQYTRRALINKYIRICCSITNDSINDAVDHLLEYLHHNIEISWQYDIGFLFDLLQNSGVNVERLINLLEYVNITELLNDVQLKSKFNYNDQMKSHASNDQIINSIKRVFRILLSLCYFQIEKLPSTLSNDNHLFLFLLGFYLQLDRRFQDINIIHLTRRLMIKSLAHLQIEYWNEKRDCLVECLYSYSSKNVYIIELFLKINERSVRIRSQLAFLHLKRLIQLTEHEKKSESMIIEEIIRDKLHPRLFERQWDFIDSVRLLADIIDNYPFDQQIKYLSKLYEKILPFTRSDHEKLLTDEQHLILFDDCQRWGTIVKSHFHDDQK